MYSKNGKAACVSVAFFHLSNNFPSRCIDVYFDLQEL